MKISEKSKLKKRHRRVRAKIKGSAGRPRLVVSRSIAHIYAQIIDDENGNTLVSASDYANKKNSKPSSKGKGASKSKTAEEVGRDIAKKAKGAGIASVVFDRGGRAFHGRVRALADAARAEGLKF